MRDWFSRNIGTYASREHVGSFAGSWWIRFACLSCVASSSLPRLIVVVLHSDIIYLLLRFVCESHCVRRTRVWRMTEFFRRCFSWLPILFVTVMNMGSDSSLQIYSLTKADRPAWLFAAYARMPNSNTLSPNILNPTEISVGFLLYWSGVLVFGIVNTQYWKGVTGKWSEWLCPDKQHKKGSAR